MTYDPEVDAAYISLTDAQLTPGRESVPCEPPEGVHAMVFMDWKDGKIVGVEVLGASALLHPDVIEAAGQPVARARAVR